ncbi:MAG: AAA family ATPase [Aestuariivita sp.]|nr:AAA family ATPase [Aestuariivita sp.]MCY4202682.1 AAA family ATPase [Aestuariivita sp.]
MRDSGSYYVDKTPLIRDLIERGDHWFLSRPRRFGKSLLVDTLKALFEGREHLFCGLDIHAHWDWLVSHPVVRLSFDRVYARPQDIEDSILVQLQEIEHNARLETSAWQKAPEYLFELLNRLHRKTGQRVVVLVDEYDKPILDAIKDPERARANRDYLCNFYGIIKGRAEHIRFVLVTGVSMFSKVSVFSDLNNLHDISLDPSFAAICGYTDTDLDTVFAPELDGLDRDEIRTWYNGYNWLGPERVYNPFDLLLLFAKRTFKPHWFRTGSPRFLLETLLEKAINPLELERCVVDETQIAKFEVEDFSAEALMFQAGYLTITDEIRRGHRTAYRLDYPNQEVKLSLNDELLAYLSPTNQIPVKEGETLRDRLEANDFRGFADKCRAYLAGIPYQWHTTGDLARYEAWYAGLLYMCFRAAGVDVHPEEASNHGRADMVIVTGGQVFVLEFKMVETADEAEVALATAFAQIRDQGYAKKYLDRNEPVHLVAVICDCSGRTLLDVRSERVR